MIGGGAAAFAAWFYLDGGNDTLTTLESRLAAAEQQVGEVSALNERVDAIEAAPAETATGNDEMAARLGDLEAKVTAFADMPASDADSGLGDRLASLEQQIETLAGDIQAAAQAGEASTAAIRGIEETLPTLSNSLAETDKAVSATSEQASTLGQSIEALSGEVQTLATRVGEAESELDHLGGEYQRGAAMIVAIGDVDRAITRAEPFDSALSSLKSLVRDDALLGETLPLLEPVAASGVPTLSALKETFADMASGVLLAEEGDRSLTDQVSDNVFGIIRMRPSGAEVSGPGSRAVLARAQAALSSGDLEAAVAELSELEGSAAEASASWVERASSRLSAEAAVLDLRSHAQGLVAKGS